MMTYRGFSSRKFYKLWDFEDIWRIYCSIVDEGPRGCRANYKQAVARHVRGGAKTKDMRLRQKTRGC